MSPNEKTLPSRPPSGRVRSAHSATAPTCRRIRQTVRGSAVVRGAEHRCRAQVRGERITAKCSSHDKGLACTVTPRSSSSATIAPAESREKHFDLPSDLQMLLAGSAYQVTRRRSRRLGRGGWELSRGEAGGAEDPFVGPFAPASHFPLPVLLIKYYLYTSFRRTSPLYFRTKSCEFPAIIWLCSAIATLV